jgi:hypothetical protein
VSARTGSQTAQLTPPLPHAMAEGVMHWVPSQQPLAHDDGSHTHWLFMHRCPALHAGLAPHWHWPLTHALARLGSHTAHEVPAPHWATVCVPVAMHVPFAQQSVVPHVSQPAQTPLLHAPLHI